MARNFISTTDKVSIADNDALDILANLSIYCWAYLNAASVYHSLVTKSNGNGATTTPFDFRTNNTATPSLVLARAAAASTARTSTFTISTGIWTHLAVTDKGDGTASNNLMYKNAGTPDITTACPAPTANAKPVLIGERDDALGGNCRIAWVGVHNVILTQGEIAEAMLCGFTMRGLIGCWPLFGDATEADLSGNLFNGTVTPTSTDTGYKNPSAHGSRFLQWDNPTNVYISNNLRAIAATTGYAHDFYNFAFGVPEGATINGIEISCEWQTTGGNSISEATIQFKLSWDTGLNWTAAKGLTRAVGDGETYQAAGGSTDTWGRTWISNELNNTYFRILVTYAAEDEYAMQAEIDHLRLKIFYTTSGTGVPGPGILPPWHRSVSENITAFKNELTGYPGQNSMIGGKLYHKFIKTPQKTGVTGREGFNLNNLAP